MVDESTTRFGLDLFEKLFFFKCYCEAWLFGGFVNDLIKQKLSNYFLIFLLYCDLIHHHTSLKLNFWLNFFLCNLLSQSFDLNLLVCFCLCCQPVRVVWERDSFCRASFQQSNLEFLFLHCSILKIWSLICWLTVSEIFFHIIFLDSLFINEKLSADCLSKELVKTLDFFCLVLTWNRVWRKRRQVFNLNRFLLNFVTEDLFFKTSPSWCILNSSNRSSRHH